MKEDILYNSLQKMTDLQRRVAEEYVACNIISLAAKKAGIEGENARISAWQMLQHDDVQDYIDQLRAEQQERTKITADRVLREAARVTFSDIRDYYNEDGTLKNITDLSDDAAAALAGVDVDELFEMVNGKKVYTGYSKKIKLYDKLSGIEKLMKHLGLYKNDNDQNRPVINNRLQIEIVQPLEED